MLPLKIIRRLHDAGIFKYRGHGYIHYLCGHIRWHWIKTSGDHIRMSNLIIGFFLGVASCTIGFTGMAKVADAGVQKVQKAIIQIDKE